MSWFSKIAGKQGSIIKTTIAGKEISVFCTRSADKALAKRERPLLVEIELAFACIAHKQVRFQERATAADAIKVNEQLTFVITTLMPGNGETAGVRSFMPKWVRIDYSKGKWAGEYGF
jgi:hypothetical protein